LAVFSLSIFSSERINGLSNGSHGDSYPCFNLPFNISHRHPVVIFKVEEPKLIKKDFIFVSASID
jgi:hypothetical protein